MRRQIVLASSSPRRRELIQMLGIDAIITASLADEAVEPGRSPQQIVEELALRKASTVTLNLEEEDGDAVVIGSDTIVVLEGDILGKPRDAEEAKQMLQRLRGRQHSVFTGLACVKAAGMDEMFGSERFASSYASDLLEQEVETELFGDIGQSRVILRSRKGQPVITVGHTVSKVTFRQMSLEEIDAYVRTGEPLDKAGAYGVQGLGAVFVEKIEGDFYSVMGLPVNLLYRTLQSYDIRPF